MPLKQRIMLILALVLLLSATACSGSSMPLTALAETAVNTVATPDTVTTPTTPAATAVPVTVEYASEDLTPNDATAASTTITLDGSAITVTGAGAVVDGSRVTITAAGTYSLSGILHDGQIAVETADSDPVVLVLNGIQVTNTISAPIYVRNAGKVIITLAEGTQNVITDEASYQFPDAETDEPNAALFSNDDLTINGSGTLIVNANYNNGIASDDELKITGGTLTVTAVNDGIQGRDGVAIKDGAITINAGGDGIQATNAEDAEYGTIAIEGGVLDITAARDGMQAETSLLISGGDVNLATGSGKGLKAAANITITGGAIVIDAADDAVHSNGTLTIQGGSLTLASGDDGIHADAALTIDDGAITLTQSYEGLESALITINGGNIHLVANDDGINVAGGNDGSSVNGRPGQNEFANIDSYHLTITGGYIYVDAGGDGLDSNGAFDMTGGTVIVNGPTENNNGPLDYMGSFNMTGGFLVAVGSSGMAQAPSQTSSVYALMHNFDAMQAAGTLVHVESAIGENVLTFMPTKAYQSVLIASPALQNGGSYTVYTGGSATGTAVDGLYSATTYTPGTQAASYTLTSVVTTGGAMGGFGGPGGGGPRPRP